MATLSNILKQKIKQAGTWNFKDLYSFCYDFLKDSGYSISENEYTEKTSPDGKELIIDWTARKKVTDYFKNIISVKWHILRMKDVEAEREGKKISTNKGDLKIEIAADLEQDYEERWEKKPHWKFLRGFYEKYIIRTTIDEYGGRLKEDALEFIDQIKSFLQL